MLASIPSFGLIGIDGFTVTASKVIRVVDGHRTLR